MALSYFSEGEAPRDFRVSSSESDGHYTKCLLCYNVRRNFYCVDCIKTGNVLHTSMPYSDRYSEKQMKLYRLKANRKHVLDRCEKLLISKMKKDKLLTEVKQSRDRLDLLRLAIEQTRNKVEDKRKELMNLKQFNLDLNSKLPRYEKRVLLLEKLSLDQQIELHHRVGFYNDQVNTLAALRRSRIRQLINYIFPVYVSYDMSDSMEDVAFVSVDAEEEAPKRSQLHILSSCINVDGDFTYLHAWCNSMSASKKSSPPAAAGCGAHRTQAALALCSQLAALLAWTLAARTPHPLPLSEYCSWEGPARTVGGQWQRLQAACAALGRLAPAPPTPTAACSLLALHHIACAAIADDPLLGRGEVCSEVEWAECAAVGADDDPPEHLHWPDHQQWPQIEELVEVPPPAVPSAPSSLVTSIASIWRGWAK